jgi:hypothetical protein
MLVQITGSQLLMFPTYKLLSYHGTLKQESKFKLFNIEIIECDKDLSNFDYMGKVTGVDEITILVNPTHYQDLIHLHMSRQKPNTMYLKLDKKYVSYYGFNC